MLLKLRTSFKWCRLLCACTYVCWHITIPLLSSNNSAQMYSNSLCLPMHRVLGLKWEHPLIATHSLWVWLLQLIIRFFFCLQFLVFILIFNESNLNHLIINNDFSCRPILFLHGFKEHLETSFRVIWMWPR